jgi:hypothetical protein
MVPSFQTFFFVYAHARHVRRPPVPPKPWVFHTPAKACSRPAVVWSVILEGGAFSANYRAAPEVSVAIEVEVEV